MGTLYLIIKGDKFQAARAAADRGIGFVFVREIRDIRAPGRVETVGRCGDQHLAAVRDWYATDPVGQEQPVGALLLWSEETAHPVRLR